MKVKTREHLSNCALTQCFKWVLTPSASPTEDRGERERGRGGAEREREEAQRGEKERDAGRTRERV